MLWIVLIRDLALGTKKHQAANKCCLTRKQVEMIFMKGKVAEMFEAVKVSDVIEALNHCVCVDYILDHISEPITVSFLRKLHLLLMKGTVDEAKQRVVAKRKEKFILPARQRGH